MTSFFRQVTFRIKKNRLAPLDHSIIMLLQYYAVITAMKILVASAGDYKLLLIAEKNDQLNGGNYEESEFWDCYFPPARRLRKDNEIRESFL